MRTKWAGWLAGAGTAALLYAYAIERAQVELSRHTVLLDTEGLPPEGVTILHLSDFHFRESDAIQERKIRRLLQLVAQEQYDIVALTGDLVHDIGGFPVALRLIRALRPRWAAFSVPGNHDYAEYSVWGVLDQTRQQTGSAALSVSRVKGLARQLADFIRKVLRNELVRLPVAANDVPSMHARLREAGVEPLVNQAVSVQWPDGVLWIAGVDDPTEGAPDLARTLMGVPDGVPLIMLAHNPDAFLDPAIERADLVLSGHTHGGQIRLPGIGAAHTQGTHLTRRRPAGWFRRGNTQMFVSRGLGESIPLRFGVRPQAALITLRNKQGAANR
jgi:predicted MPP superfamily phosphohydrolase